MTNVLTTNERGWAEIIWHGRDSLSLTLFSEKNNAYELEIDQKYLDQLTLAIASNEDKTITIKHAGKDRKLHIKPFGSSVKLFWDDDSVRKYCLFDVVSLLTQLNPRLIAQYRKHSNAYYLP